MKGILHVLFREMIHLILQNKGKSWPQTLTNLILSHFRIASLGQQLYLYYMVCCTHRD